jgi:hypothetical protein
MLGALKNDRSNSIKMRAGALCPDSSSMRSVCLLTAFILWNSEMTYDLINLMLPTYKRPAQLGRCIDSALRNADSIDNLRFTFCVNERDQETIEYLSSSYWPDPLMWQVVFEKTQQPNLAYYYNLLYDKTDFGEPSTLVSMVGDDMIFASPGWDKEILGRMNECDGLAVIHADDDYIGHDRLCVNLFTSRRIVAATKRPFMCPKYHAEMIDVVWTYIGMMLQVKERSLKQYLRGVTIRHEHFTRKPTSEHDDTAKRLSPLREIANTKENMHWAVSYATVSAANIVMAGEGVKWNLGYCSQC